MPSRFFSLHRQGMVRVAACTPRIAVGDPARNAAETLEVLREGRERSVDLMLFPELGLSAYAIDDLLLQDALLDARRGAPSRSSSTAARDLLPRVPRRRAGAPQRRGSTTARSSSPAGAIARRRAEDVPAQLPRVSTSSAGSPRAPASPGARSPLAGQAAPFGTDLSSPRADLADFIFHVEICEDFWAPVPPSTQRARWPARRSCATCRRRTSSIGKADERALLCAVAVDALPCRLRLFRRRVPARAPPTSPGTARRRSTNWATLLAETERFPTHAADVRRRRRRRAHAPRAPAHGDLQRRRGRAPAIRSARSGASRFEHAAARPRRGPRARRRPLPVRARRPRPARPRLLRGLQHPGAGPAQAPRSRPAASTS